MRKAPLGDLELEILRFVAEHSPCSVRQVTAEFGEPRGLARTTVLTVMERLRAKGYLARSKNKGANTYSAVQAQDEVMHDIVQEFVDKTLGGSLTPFVAYLAKSKGLSATEIEHLKAMVEDIEEQSK